MKRLLGLSGSLRHDSACHRILQQVKDMLPDTISFHISEKIGLLPHFNNPTVTPETVEPFLEELREADAIIICTPEYAFGVPGSLKNAIDWTVGTGEFVHKPVALVTAASLGDKAHYSLLQTLGAVSAKVTPELSLLIPYVKAKCGEKGLHDPSTLAALHAVINELVHIIDSTNV